MNDNAKVKGPKKPNPQPFLMKRNFDTTGNSGVGIVMEGCVFSNGEVAYTWRSGRKTRVWCESFEAFRELHIDAHPANETEIIWLHEEEPSKEASGELLNSPGVKEYQLSLLQTKDSNND